MKRTSAIILTLVLAISLAACGDYSVEDVKTPSTVAIGNYTDDVPQGE